MTEHEATIATYEADGQIYEIDHLGVLLPDDWGNFAVYRDNTLVAEFCLPAFRNPLLPRKMPPDDELIEMAKAAVTGDLASWRKSGGEWLERGKTGD